jgi:hypothetical protein
MWLGVDPNEELGELTFDPELESGLDRWAEEQLHSIVVVEVDIGVSGSCVPACRAKPVNRSVILFGLPVLNDRVIARGVVRAITLADTGRCFRDIESTAELLPSRSLDSGKWNVHVEPDPITVFRKCIVAANVTQLLGVSILTTEFKRYLDCRVNFIPNLYAEARCKAWVVVELAKEIEVEVVSGDLLEEWEVSSKMNVFAGKRQVSIKPPGLCVNENAIFWVDVTFWRCCVSWDILQGSSLEECFFLG